MLVRQDRPGSATPEIDAPAPGPAAPRRPGRPPAILTVTGILLFLVASTAAWALATPLGGYPDDIDHYLRAAGMSHGQVLGEPNPYLDIVEPPTAKACCGGPNPAAEYWVQSGLRSVTVPSGLRPEQVRCDAIVRNTRVVCGTPPAYTGDRYDTLMGTIEPLAYVAPGVALALFGDSSNAFRYGRLALALVGIAAIGLVLVGCSRRPSFARRAIGLALATTPMVVFVLSSGSPNAAETAGAIGAWLAVLELTAAPAERAPRTLWAGLALSGALLASARSLGPIFVLGTLGLVLVARGARPFLDRVKVDRGPALVTLGVVATSALGTVLWEIFVQPHLAIDREFAAGQLDMAWADVPRVLHEIVGVFGSLELPLPDLVVRLWLGLGTVAVVLALVTARGRGRLALVGLLVSTLIAIVAIDVLVMRQNGFPIQGRHVLALFVGIPILAADLARRPPWLTRLVPRELLGRLGVTARVVTGLAAGLLAVLHLYAWTYATSSYTPTPTGRVLTPAFAGNWAVTSPKPLAALATVGAVAVAAAIAWTLLPSNTHPDDGHASSTRGIAVPPSG